MKVLILLLIFFQGRNSFASYGAEIHNMFHLRNCIEDVCLCQGGGRAVDNDLQATDIEGHLSTLEVVWRSESKRSLLSCVSLCSLDSQCDAVFTRKSGGGTCLMMEGAILEDMKQQAKDSSLIFAIEYHGEMESCSLHVKKQPEPRILDSKGCPYIEIIEDVLRKNAKRDEDEWMIVQRKIDDSLSFDRSWEEFKDGFGDVRRNFWLGLEKLHQYTEDGQYGLKVEVIGSETLERNVCSEELMYCSEEIETIIVGPEQEGYKLSLSEENPSAAFMKHNGAPFRTKDRPNSALNYPDNHDDTGWWCADQEAFEPNRSIDSLFHIMGGRAGPSVFFQLKIKKKN